MSGERLYAAIKKITKRALPAEDQTDLVYGIVRSINPLKVEIENKFTILESQIYLSPLCTRKEIKFTVPTRPNDIDMQVELWPDLEVNDVLIMLRHSQGQGFYALQRAGSL